MRVSMKIGKLFKVSRKTFFNPSAWLGYDAIRTQHEIIKEDLKEVFRVETADREETFEEALIRLQLSPEEVQQRMVSYYRYAYCLCACGLVVFFYAFHLLFKLKYVSPFLLGLASSSLLLAQAFRFHFWAYQIRVRKLGATFNEWKKDLLGDKSAST
jgi:intracellular multiplication protein IcmV